MQTCSFGAKIGKLCTHFGPKVGNVRVELGSPIADFNLDFGHVRFSGNFVSNRVLDKTFIGILSVESSHVGDCTSGLAIQLQIAQGRNGLQNPPLPWYCKSARFLCFSVSKCFANFAYPGVGSLHNTRCAATHLIKLTTFRICKCHLVFNSLFNN